MKLWLFGDSFSVSRENINKGQLKPQRLWHEILADKFNLLGYHNYAQWGVSNEYILEQFLTHQTEYEPNDCIVIQLTSSARQWFFKDAPEIANFYVEGISETISTSEATAVNMYAAHLQRPEIDELRYFMLVKTLEKLSQDLNYCKMLVLPGFHMIPGVTGTMLDICYGEFVSNESRLEWYKNHRVDPRPNHIGPDNHEILGNRIFEFFQTGKSVDLTNGYKQGFL